MTLIRSLLTLIRSLLTLIGAPDRDSNKQQHRGNDYPYRLAPKRHRIQLVWAGDYVYVCVYVCVCVCNLSRSLSLALSLSLFLSPIAWPQNVRALNWCGQVTMCVCGCVGVWVSGGHGDVVFRVVS